MQAAGTGSGTAGRWSARGPLTRPDTGTSGTRAGAHREARRPAFDVPGQAGSYPEVPSTEGRSVSGMYFIGPGEKTGWTFTAGQLAETARELRPDATVSGPAGGALDIELPGQPWEHTITYAGKPASFTFKEDDGVPAAAGLVLQILQRLAPAARSVWFADFIDGTEHAFRPQDLTTAEFIREIWGEPA